LFFALPPRVKKTPKARTPKEDKEESESWCVKENWEERETVIVFYDDSGKSRLFWLCSSHKKRKKKKKVKKRGWKRGVFLHFQGKRKKFKSSKTTALLSSFLSFVCCSTSHISLLYILFFYLLFTRVIYISST
jgi:hypothetical protein